MTSPRSLRYSPNSRWLGWPEPWPGAAAADRSLAATYGVGVSSSQMIDWNVAASTATRWVRPGPQVSLPEARRVVAELREQAAAVAEPVRAVTGLPGDDDGGKVAVVDRPGWIKTKITRFPVVPYPLAQHLPGIRAPPAARSALSPVASPATRVHAPPCPA